MGQRRLSMLLCCLGVTVLTCIDGIAAETIPADKVSQVASEVVAATKDTLYVPVTWQRATLLPVASIYPACPGCCTLPKVGFPSTGHTGIMIMAARAATAAST